jgi:hypothetical protein
VTMSMGRGDVLSRRPSASLYRRSPECRSNAMTARRYHTIALVFVGIVIGWMTSGDVDALMHWLPAGIPFALGILMCIFILPGLAVDP